MKLESKLNLGQEESKHLIKEKILSLSTKIKEYYYIIFSENIAEEILPKDKKEVEELRAVAEEIHGGTLRKISEQLGSNEGGWYEDQETGIRWYVKFYKNPNQARIEFVANAVYKKLGIRAVESRLLEMDGKLAIASQEIPGAQGTTKDEQKLSVDVRDGFVADAYLANWDVVGLVFDNLVKGEDGGFYRIDNGGALSFRAQGDTKDFSSNEIPELKNMRNMQYPAGKVFEGLTEEEIKSQAEKLVKALEDVDIDLIIDQAGLSEEISAKLKESLKGRKKVLARRFGTKEKKPQTASERIPVAIEKLREQSERLKGVELWPRVGFLVDQDKIENQQIDIIDSGDRGLYQIIFKLTSEHHKRILDKIRTMPYADLEDYISYQGIGDYEKFRLTKALLLKFGDNEVRVSKGTNDYGDHVYSSQGLVQINIPKDKVISPEDLNKQLEEILKNFFEINNGLEAPNQEAESNYKRARYVWHHKIEGLPTEESGEVNIESRLKRREVFPGYFTFVEEGKHKEYEKMSPYGVYHTLLHQEILPKIIKAGGLLCTHERYRRGLMLNGTSSTEDLNGGGGIVYLPIPLPRLG